MKREEGDPASPIESEKTASTDQMERGGKRAFFFARHYHRHHHHLASRRFPNTIKLGGAVWESTHIRKNKVCTNVVGKDLCVVFLTEAKSAVPFGRSLLKRNELFNAVGQKKASGRTNAALWRPEK